MEKPKFLISINRAPARIFLFVKDFFGRSPRLNFKTSLSRKRLADCFSAAAAFVFLSAGIFTAGCLVVKSLKPGYDFSPVGNFFRWPPFSDKAGGEGPGNGQISQAPQTSTTLKADIPVPEIPENSGETVKPGEEIRDVISRQLKDQVLADPAAFNLREEYLQDQEKLDSFLDKKVSQIMISNNIIRDDGHILTVAPGTRVILTLDGYVRIIGDSYFQNAGQTSAEGLQSPAD